MAAVESSLVLLPRPTTLVGATSFTTLPLDVSGFGSVQLQLWRGPTRGAGSPTIKFYFEESLDTETWALGPSTPVGYDPADETTGGDPTLAKPQLFSYAFRLRWFRLRIETTGTAPIFTCWAEGLLRDGGGGGSWTQGKAAPVIEAARAMGPPAMARGRGAPPGTPWSGWSDQSGPGGTGVGSGGTAPGTPGAQPSVDPSSPPTGRSAGTPSPDGNLNPFDNIKHGRG